MLSRRISQREVGVVAVLGVRGFMTRNMVTTCLQEAAACQ